jgi:hypothetical protein
MNMERPFSFIEYGPLVKQFSFVNAAWGEKFVLSTRDVEKFVELLNEAYRLGKENTEVVNTTLDQPLSLTVDIHEQVGIKERN